MLNIDFITLVEFVIKLKVNSKQPINSLIKTKVAESGSSKRIVKQSVY